MKTSFAMFVLSFFLQLSLMYYYSIHGWVVYLNPRQHVSLTIGDTVSAISVGLAARIRVCLLPRNSDDSGGIHR